MDKIERYVYNWIFELQGKVNLQKRLEEIGKDKIANKKFKTLNDIAKRKLNQIGANKSKVPVFLRVLNVGLLIVAIIIVIRHIMFNGFDIYTNNIQ